jgi:transcriptional regulator with XRE-family HTH domain
MVSDKIKFLRDKNNMTQTDLAKKLNLTRSSVNSWEQGLNVPSTPLIVELARLFQVSTDYLLGVDNTSSLDTSGLSEADSQIIYGLIKHLRELNKNSNQR